MITPGTPRHDRWLQQLLGDWTTESHCDTGPSEPPQQSTGANIARLGDLWVVFEGTGTIPGGGERRMLMTLGYDPDKNRFRGTWVGSMMTHMFVYEGTLDADESAPHAGDRGPQLQGRWQNRPLPRVITWVSRVKERCVLRAAAGWELEPVHGPRTAASEPGTKPPHRGRGAATRAVLVG